MDDADEFKLSRSSVVAGDAPTQAASEPSSTEVARAPLRGYQVGKLLGRGGMGEVVLARDERIGRDVAIKRMRGTRPGDVGVVRFLREARIQARLEHPAIVPVHELGEDVDHQPYFTMKRLSGITLAEQLALPAPPLRQKLLRAFVEVCRAVEFAHASGVVHRDLKPANVMLGDFGEVYVLDWGLARVVGEPEPLSVAAGVDSLAGETQPGAILGTPGYMSPEQVRGASDVGPASDVYALGAILFELLAGEPLHVRGSAVLRSSLGPTDGSASQRQPERAIPPELDSLCIAALASDRAARPSASELAERIERYLDGDRDLERRRELAATSIAEAHTALASDVVGGRARAMQAAGRALALDPESHDAAALVTRLMLEPATRLPPELEEELSASEARVQRRQSRVATLSFIAVVGFLLMASWNGLRSAAMLIGVSTLTTVMAVVAYRLSRRRARPGEMMLVAIGNATLAAVLSRAFGPLIIAPAVTCVMAVSLTSYPQLIDRAKSVIALLALSWSLPVLLERIGVLRSTWWVAEGEVVSTSSLVTIGGTSTAPLLIAANIITIVVIGLFANALARSRRDAQRQVEIQAWHLRQLLPTVTG